MKEQVTVRVCDAPERRLHWENARVGVDPEISGGACDRGDTLPLNERNGGRLFGVIDPIDAERRSDEHGASRLASVWMRD